MRAIVMAGGEGTRLKSVTGDRPKPMALLAGKPVLEHILALLRRNGITEACLTLRYRPEVIRDYFGDGSAFGMKLEYHVEAEPLGTAGGVRACAAWYGREDFLVISGDAACDFDLRALAKAHRERGAAVTMALYSRETPLQYGTVLTDRSGRVVSFCEKPDWSHVVSDLVNTGIYVVRPEAMDLVPEGEPWDFARDLFPALMAAEQPILGVPMAGYWCDIGTPRAYHQCNLDALDGRLELAPSPRELSAKPTEGVAPSPRELSAKPTEGVAPSPRELSTKPTEGVFPCRSRARLMRELSCSGMEAGADMDLSAGLTLRLGDNRLHVAPSTEEEALRYWAEGKAAGALTDECGALLAELEDEICN